MFTQGFLSFFLLTSFGIIYILVPTGSSFPISKQPWIEKSIRAVEASTASDCDITGNTDFYGLGIRIGIYLQWLTSLLANRYLHEEIQPNLETNTIFLLAVFIATVIASIQETTKPPEIIVLLYLCFGFIFSILSIWGKRARSTAGNVVSFSYSGSLVRLTLVTSICIYTSWFWFAGLSPADDSQCTRYTFIFTKIDVRSGIRHLYQALSVVTAVTYGFLWLRELTVALLFLSATVFYSSLKALAVTYFCSNNVKPPTYKYEFSTPSLKSFFKRWISIIAISFWSLVNNTESGESRPAVDFWLVTFLNFFIIIIRTFCQFWMLFVFKRCTPVGFPPTLNYSTFDPIDGSRLELVVKRVRRFFQSEYLQNALFVINTVFIVWTIISVEIILLWNNITGIYLLNSTGQLIPFIIAVIGFLRVSHGILVLYCEIQNTDILLQMLDNELGPTSKCNILDVVNAHKEIYQLRDGTATVFNMRSIERRHSFSDVDLDHLSPQDGFDRTEQSSVNPGLKRRKSMIDLDKVRSQSFTRELDPRYSRDTPSLERPQNSPFPKIRPRHALLYCFGISLRLIQRLVEMKPLRNRFEFAIKVLSAKVLDHFMGIKERSLKHIDQRKDDLDEFWKSRLQNFINEKIQLNQPPTDDEALSSGDTKTQVLFQKINEDLILQQRWTPYLYTFRTESIPALLAPSLHEFLQSLIKVALQLLQTLYPIINRSFLHSASKLRELDSALYDLKRIRQWKRQGTKKITLEMQHLLAMDTSAQETLQELYVTFRKDFENWSVQDSKTPSQTLNNDTKHRESHTQSERGDDNSSLRSEESSIVSSYDLEKGLDRKQTEQTLSVILATVATIHAAHGVYASISASEKRRMLVLRGEMSPEEARSRKSKNILQDAAAIGIAAISVKSAYSEILGMAKYHKKKHELEACRRRLEKYHERREKDAQNPRLENGNSIVYPIYFDNHDNPKDLSNTS